MKPCRAISRAILKPVYQFEITKSDPLTAISVKINSSKKRQITIHALVPQCALFVLSYSECKIAKIFKGFTPEPHRGRLPAIPLPPDSPAAQWLFLLTTLIKKPAPLKNCWIWHCICTCLMYFWYHN